MLGVMVVFAVCEVTFAEPAREYGRVELLRDSWGVPHVFAVFLIVAASGALNVASIASVFGKTAYKPLAPLSGLVAIISCSRKDLFHTGVINTPSLKKDEGDLPISFETI